MSNLCDSRKTLWTTLMVAALLALPHAAFAAPTWYDSDWGLRQEVTVNPMGNTAGLSDFPVLVKLDDSSNPLFGQAQADGDDIFFTDASGTKLNHEIEYYSDGGTKQLAAWVKLPTLPTSGTTLYMYYQNPGTSSQENVNGTWNSDFRLVQHLQENPGGTTPQMTDSTSYGNNGTSVGGMTAGDQVSGQIDGSLDFDGSNDYIDFGNDASLNVGSGSFTFSMWIKTDAADPAGWPYVFGTGSTHDRYGFYQHDSNGQLYWEWGVPPAYTGWTSLNVGDITDLQWHLATVTFDATDSKFRTYFDGVLNSTYGGTTTPNPSILGVRLGQAWGAAFDGQLDEARISAVAEDIDWILASFTNQNLGQDSLGFGSQEVVPEPSTLAMLLGLAGLGLLRYIRRRRS